MGSCLGPWPFPWALDEPLPLALEEPIPCPPSRPRGAPGPVGAPTNITTKKCPTSKYTHHLYTRKSFTSLIEEMVPYQNAF